MRILRVHNRYQQRGGEDACFEAECDLLRAHEQEVHTLVVSNDDIPDARSLGTSLQLAATTIWSSPGRRQVSEAVHRTGADVVHFDNTFPLISPAAYSAAKQAGAAVVQTLHNYRIICPAYTLLRDGRPCGDCLGKRVPVPAVVHACYHDSRGQTAVVASMLAAHSLRGTWSKDIDRYIALTAFAKEKFVAHGIPERLIAVKPNFVDRPRSTAHRQSGTFLFVGRLSAEKGIATLIDAARIVGDASTIRVVGDGPLLDQVRGAATERPGLRAEGRLGAPEVGAAMSTAQALVFPSIWYEGFPMTILEAFANGLPVIASGMGSMAEIVEDGKTGLLFEPGNADDLTAKLSWATDHPTEMARMGDNARREYESRYAPERNYQLLMDIYRQAVGASPVRNNGSRTSTRAYNGRTAS